jgi:hypothetical protein
MLLSSKAQAIQPSLTNPATKQGIGGSNNRLYYRASTKKARGTYI